MVDQKTRRIHRERNYDLCMALNQIKLGIILDKMVDVGDLARDKASWYKQISSSLLMLLREENDRIITDDLHSL